jgi:DNA-binding transcriptional regulator WhiA
VVDAGVMKLVNMRDSKSRAARLVGSSPTSSIMLDLTDRTLVAYIVGIALGDGNLSNPNGRAVRLRITCDSKYPFLILKIEKSLRKLAPKNKVSRINRSDNAIDISCYSNQWEKILGWKAQNGSKVIQKICVPDWIFQNKKFCRACLCGLWETDGSVYKDRKYLTAHFVTQIPSLANCVEKMLLITNYKASKQSLKLNDKRTKFTFRIHENAEEFIKEIGINKK